MRLSNLQDHDLPYEIIVFVCTNQRAEGERVCCAGRGSVNLHARLKQLVQARGLKPKVRVSKSGCMDQCEEGPNVMMFPGCRWFSAVQDEDLERLLSLIEAKLQDTESPL